ncbi:23S rRNA pseudouridine2605 synthase [Pustulibacterium marinum]|uniref:23S rRNA pseudouridine2605 synthase n=1 Tax=Pustulibacterium marinum TaxID=1224947 RepID=A0A1I7EUU8_9FLAO|nr:pseudouridine synthase [Pustulibacterium marinum]SFU27682.1 23S rRNA pseudouridine2605 synthase [Pustulibacterium marinum]
MSRTDKSSGKQSGRQGGGNKKGSFTRGNAPIKKKWEKKKPASNAPIKKSEGIRLNKYIANSGVCSRRDADIYIASGNVLVNGEPVTEMGYKVNPTDEVKFDGRLITPEKVEYLLLNKPKGFAVLPNLEVGKRSVLELISNATKSRISSIDRLDRPSTGLLLFTNDVALSQKLNHASSSVTHLYHIALEKNLSHADLLKIREGLNIDDVFVEVEEITYTDQGSKRELGVRVKGLKSKTVKRIFEQLGYEIKMMDRVMIAELTKKDLPRGHWRFLTSQEVINLKNMK